MKDAKTIDSYYLLRPEYNGDEDVSIVPWIPDTPVPANQICPDELVSMAIKNNLNIGLSAYELAVEKWFESSETVSDNELLTSDDLKWVLRAGLGIRLNCYEYPHEEYKILSRPDFRFFRESN